MTPVTPPTDTAAGDDAGTTQGDRDAPSRGFTHYYGDGCPGHNRCEGYNTEPGVSYHAHDLPRCHDDGVRRVEGWWLCEAHAQEKEAWRRGVPMPARDGRERAPRVVVDRGVVTQRAVDHADEHTSRAETL